MIVNKLIKLLTFVVALVACLNLVSVSMTYSQSKLISQAVEAQENSEGEKNSSESEIKEILKEFIVLNEYYGLHQIDRNDLQHKRHYFTNYNSPEVLVPIRPPIFPRC